MQEVRRRQTLADRSIAVPGLVDHGQVVERHRIRLEREAATGTDLSLCAQVDHGLQSNRSQHRKVCVGESPEPVGAEDGAPPNGSPVGSLVSAEIAEVEHSVEVDTAAERCGVHAVDAMGVGFLATT